jgi:uncharacterized RDD family membrane protein YckC
MLKIDRHVLRPVSAATDAALASSVVESVARSLVDHRVGERFAAELVAALRESRHDDAAATLERVLGEADSERVLEVVIDSVAASPAFERAVVRLIRSPDVRRALSASTGGFAVDVATELRAKLRAVDDATQARLRRLLRRPRLSPGALSYGGGAARALALVIDILLAQVVVAVGVLTVRLVMSIGPWGTTGTAGKAAASVAWTLLLAVYFCVFWTTVGQTPGMRLLGLGVTTADGRPLSLSRALVRFVALVIAIAPAFAGLWPVLVDRRRRGLQDFVAGTVVVETA